MRSPCKLTKISRFALTFFPSFKFVVVLNLLALESFAQIGGRGVFHFLDLPPSARIAGLGATLVPVRDYDLSIGLYNPSLLNSEMDRQVLMNFSSLAGDIRFGNSAFGMNFGKAGFGSVSLQYLSYGKFDETDASGQMIGQFSGGDYLMSTGWGYSIDSLFTVGANLKFAYSELYDLKSTGLGLDLAGSYHNRKQNLTATFIVRNAGLQLTGFNPDERESMPVRIQAGISKKFRYMPIRFGLIFEDLQKWDLSFSNPDLKEEVDPLTGEVSENKTGFGKKVLLHTSYSAEFLLTRYFNLRFGYRFRSRSELAMESRPGMTGMTIGAGFKISKFIFNYGRSFTHLAGGMNQFSISMNLNEFGKKASVSAPKTKP